MCTPVIVGIHPTYLAQENSLVRLGFFLVKMSQSLIINITVTHENGEDTTMISDEGEFDVLIRCIHGKTPKFSARVRYFPLLYAAKPHCPGMLLHRQLPHIRLLDPNQFLSNTTSCPSTTEILSHLSNRRAPANQNPQIPATALQTFHTTYGSLLKSSMAPKMRKRDKKKEKLKLEALAKKRRELAVDVVIGNEGKRGAGRRQRVSVDFLGSFGCLECSAIPCDVAPLGRSSPFLSYHLRYGRSTTEECSNRNC